MPIARTPSTISTIAGMSRSLGLRHAAPMQKRCDPVILGLRRSLQHRADVHQLGRLQAGVGAFRLRAIAAILGAAAGLDTAAGCRAGFRRARDARRWTLCAAGTPVRSNGRSNSCGDFFAGRVACAISLPVRIERSRELRASRPRGISTSLDTFGFRVDSHAASPIGGILWPSRRSTSAAHSTTFDPGP